MLYSSCSGHGIQIMELYLGRACPTLTERIPILCTAPSHPRRFVPHLQAVQAVGDLTHGQVCYGMTT